MNFTITNRIIDTENDENIISYNTDYIANFSFDEEWEGTVKTARFIQNGAHEDKVLVNDSCEIPSLKNGVVRIGVFNDTMTSTYKLLKVRNSIKDDSGNPAEPEPDVYAQLISLIQSGMLKGKDGYTPVKGTDYFTEEEVEAIIGESDVFSQKAGESATAAAKSEQNATLSERNALSSEQSAKKSEENVSKSEQAAEQSASNAATSASGAKTSETAAAASAKSAADSASAAEKSKSDAQTLVDNFGRTVEEATTGAVSTVNDTKDNAVNEVNALLDTIPEDYTAMAEDVDCLKSESVDSYIISRKISGLSEKTLYLYRMVLKDFFLTVRKAPSDITANDIRAYLYMYQSKHDVSNRTLDSKRNVICGYFNWLAAEEYICKNPAINIKPIKYERKHKKAMTQLDLEKIRAVCETKREKAIVEVLYSTGCRVSELEHLNISDVNFETKEVMLFGKGNKHRVSYLNAKAEVALKEYLNERSDDNKALFVYDKKPYGRLKKPGIEQIVKKIMERTSGVTVHVTPHVFRHTTATTAIDRGMGIVDVSKLLGHSRIDTTMEYITTDSNSVKVNHKNYII